MAYATQNDLVDWCGINGELEIIQLTDPNSTEVDTDLVAAKLDQADAEINARLVGVTLPMTGPYPKTLIDIACAVTRYRLYTGDRPETVKDDYKYALKLLDDIRAGRASLGLSGDETAVIGSTAQAPSVSANAVVFTEDVLATL